MTQPEFHAECQRLMGELRDARAVQRRLVRPASELPADIVPLTLTPGEWKEFAAAEKRYDAAWESLTEVLRRGPR